MSRTSPSVGDQVLGSPRAHRLMAQLHDFSHRGATVIRRFSAEEGHDDSAAMHSDSIVPVYEGRTRIVGRDYQTALQYNDQALVSIPSKGRVVLRGLLLSPFGYLEDFWDFKRASSFFIAAILAT